MQFCSKCGNPFEYNSGGVPSYTGQYCKGHNFDLTEDLLNFLKNQPLQFYDEKLELLKNGYKDKKFSEQQLRAALDRAEITLCEYLKIINQ